MISLNERSRSVVGDARVVAEPSPEPHSVRVLLVDDHEVVREGLASALASDGFELVGAVSTAAEALVLASRKRPDISLIDMRLPDMMGDRLCHELRQRLPGSAVVILSSYMSEDTVRSAMEAGACAYVSKGAGLAELRKALALAAADQPSAERPIVGQLRELMSQRGGKTRLTSQQQRVLELSAEGLTYREIGARLFISESTVRFHMQKLKAKFGTRTKAELIAYAIRSGALAPATEDLGPGR